MNKKKPYLEYLRTVFITMICVVVISFSILIIARFHVKEFVSEEEYAIQNNMIGYLISKYRRLEELNPKSAEINLKIGRLYEMLKSYEQAEDEYLVALNKRGGDYKAAMFKLAGVNVLQGEYANADYVMDKIRDSAKYSILLEKGRYYKLYGDVLSERGFYEDAINKYESSLFYLKKIKSTSRKEVEANMCSTYVLLADDYVSQNRQKKALRLLDEAKEKCRMPIMLYKLAILSLDKNPEYSVKLLETVLQKEPSIINFAIYKKILFSLKMQYAYDNDEVRSNLYDAKLARLRSYVTKNVLQEGELLFNNFKFDVKKFIVKNEYDFIYDFQVVNITNQDIPKLFAVIELYDKNGNRIYEHKENVLASVKTLMAGSDPLDVKIVLKLKKNLLAKYETVYAKFYLSKNPKVVRLLYSDNEIDVTKGKKNK